MHLPTRRTEQGGKTCRITLAVYHAWMFPPAMELDPHVLVPAAMAGPDSRRDWPTEDCRLRYAAAAHLPPHPTATVTAETQASNKP
jgi:hypothetical protein